MATGSNVIVVGWLDAVAHVTARFATGAHRLPSQYVTSTADGSARDG